MPGQAAFSPDGRELAIGYYDARTIEIRDSGTLALLAKSDAAGLTPGHIDRVAWSADSQTLYGGGIQHDDGGYFVFGWDRRGRDRRRIVAGGLHDSIGAIIPEPGGTLVVASLTGDIGVFDASGTRLASRQEGVLDFQRPADTVSNVEKPILLTDRTGLRAFWPDAKSSRSWHEFDVGSLAGVLPASQPTTEADPDGAEKKPVILFQYLQAYLNGQPLHVQPQELSASVDTSGAGILLGTQTFLHLYSVGGQERWIRPVPSTALRVRQTPDRRFAVAALRDGTLRWYRISDGRELLAVFFSADASKWVAFTPSGYFAASPDGEDLFGWKVSRGLRQTADFFPASRFHDRFFRPDIVKLVLVTQDEEEAARQANRVSARDDPMASPSAVSALVPPVVDLVSAPALFNTDHVTVEFRVRAPDGAPMMGDPLVKVNGEWEPRSRAVSQIAADGTRDLVVGPLPPHDARIEIYADNRNARSVPLVLSIKWDAAAALAPRQQGPATERKPNLYVLAVGISNYQRPGLQLAFADRDAEKFVAAMEAQRGKRYAEVSTKLLRNGDATQAVVMDGLAWFASRQAADDVGVLFLAGHGLQTPDQAYYFAPADFDPARQRETGVNYLAIRRALDAFSTAGNRALFFVDTCYAGAALGPDLAASNGATLAATLGRPDHGVVVLTASQGDQLSYENKDWGDGAFTKALLEGIVQAKADAAQTGDVTILNLGGYVTQRVRVLTERRQEPMFIMPGGSLVDFTVASH